MNNKTEPMKTTSKLFFVLALTIAITSCNSSKKVINAENEINALHELVKTKALTITAQWANPMATQSMNAIANAGLLPPGSATNRIDLMGTNSFLEIKGDSVEAHLPYYGERQIAGTYNANDVGIKFKGLPRDFEIEFNEKRKAYEMAFSINDDDEAYDINAVIFPNNKVTLYINSSQRLTINYQGVLKESVE